MNKYSTRERIKTILIILTITMDIVLGVLVYLQDRRNAEAQWIRVIPMANAHITWEGAGYNGFPLEGGSAE